MMLSNACVTSAFMWQGVAEDDKLLELWGEGCLELCLEVTQYAELSEAILHAVTDSGEEYEFPGVYDYDVSEPFGSWFRKEIERLEGSAPEKRDAARALGDAVFEFFAQDDSAKPLTLAARINGAIDSWLKDPTA
jgi:hypothetical protein